MNNDDIINIIINEWSNLEVLDFEIETCQQNSDLRFGFSTTKISH